MKTPTLYIVIPCYNEESVLPITAPQFLSKLKNLIAEGKITKESRVLFVDDGSRDKTWEIICQLSHSDVHFAGIRQSRNRGHQNAVLAGLMEAKTLCDITVSIDCDGQDDINAMDAMIDAYGEGCDVVYGVRRQRASDTFFKRFTAECFYKLMQKMGAEVVFNHADYRLISTRALDALSRFGEVNIFLRGMVPLIGYKSTSVYYDRTERIAGESHYPLKKMLSLAFDGITSLSVKPLQMIAALGGMIALVSLGGILVTLFRYLFGGVSLGGGALLWGICLLYGIQLLSLGIVGEYTGKIYLETKQRPRYIISERTYRVK